MTNFLQFDEAKTHLLSQTDYQNSPTRNNGLANQSIAESRVHNKLFYQLSTFVTAFAHMMEEKGLYANDANLSSLGNALAQFPVNVEMQTLYAYKYGSSNQYFNAANAIDDDDTVNYYTYATFFRNIIPPGNNYGRGLLCGKTVSSSKKNVCFTYNWAANNTIPPNNNYWPETISMSLLNWNNYQGHMISWFLPFFYFLSSDGNNGRMSIAYSSLSRIAMGINTYFFTFYLPPHSNNQSLRVYVTPVGRIVT